MPVLALGYDCRSEPLPLFLPLFGGNVGKRRRRDGISFRAWDQCWYTSITGRKQPLLDEHGERIRGRHNEAAVPT